MGRGKQFGESLAARRGDRRRLAVAPRLKPSSEPRSSVLSKRRSAGDAHPDHAQKVRRVARLSPEGGNISYFERASKWSQQFRTTDIMKARSSGPRSEIHAPKVTASLATSGPSFDNRSPTEQHSATARLSSVGRDGKWAPRSMRETVSVSTPTRSASFSCVHPSCFRRADRLPPSRFARRAESVFFTAIVLFFKSARMTVDGGLKQGVLCCAYYHHSC